MAKRGVHHGRTDGASNQSLKWLETQPEVKRLILNISESCRHKYAPGTIRCCDKVSGGFKIKVYGGNGIINGFVRVDESDYDDLVKRVTERFEK